MKSGSVIFSLLLLAACSKQPDTLFVSIPATKTNIHFSNQLDYTEELNAYTYRNFYNGAGVALGDINNDGLLDIYLTGNLVDNKLYLNKGNFEFEDITDKAGVACVGVWSTGATMADVNGDGLLDIYVCKSGPLDAGTRHNELFINNGDLTFSEKSKAYGLADNGLSTHAVFFDYDNDGDLDMYLLNNSGRSVGIYDLREGQRESRDTLGSNKLYQNEDNSFIDVSEQAGIYGSSIGYGLGISVSDLNKDGWQDIFISNDFFEKDYLYINQGDGTFKERLNELMSETSMGSMGADIADINNDALPDLYVTEMLPARLDREKTKAVFEDWNKYQNNFQSGYHRQFSRNVLQVNNGTSRDSTIIPFVETGRIAQIEATDWSWGALIFDVNNDGNQDIFIANGIGKDITDQDYINYSANNTIALSKAKEDSVLLTTLMNNIPSEPLANFMFINEGNLKFSNKADSLGLTHLTFSNGAAYGDLDNDGDLDLVINNINSQVLIYKNETSEKKMGNFLQIEFDGGNKNSAALGAKVTVYLPGGTILYKEQNPVKGYMSSMDPKMHFGLGKAIYIDSIVINWPDGKSSSLKGIEANQVITVDEKIMTKTNSYQSSKFENADFTVDTNFLDYKHIENDFVDFNRDPLLFEMYSNDGPVVARADVNGDGYDDLFVGGSKGEAGAIYLFNSNRFVNTSQNDFILAEDSEDSDAFFADLNGDGFLDLAVASGSNEFPFGDSKLKNRIYFNDGNGNFALKEPDDFSAKRNSTGFILPIDYDQDGDLDIMEGTRLVPFAYGVPGNVELYQNDGNGNFTNVSAQNKAVFNQIGLMTDANIIDYNKDGQPDVAIVGQWMPITILLNQNGRFEKHLIPQSSGLWNTLEVTDLNNDGWEDIVGGNHGLNSRLKANSDSPLLLYINDFDGNGAIEQILCKRMPDGKDYPLVLLPEIIKQIPSLKKKFTTFESYKNAPIDVMFAPSILSKSIKLEAVELRTQAYLNKNGKLWDRFELPLEIQYSKVCALLTQDFDGDKLPELFFGGNQYRAKPQFGINTGFKGGYLSNKKSHFKYKGPLNSGLLVEGEVRQIQSYKLQNELKLIFFRNNDSAKVYDFKN